MLARAAERLPPGAPVKFVRADARFDYTGSSTVTADLARYLDHTVIDPWHGQVPFILTESR
jgi:hypothetical protein